MKIKIRGAREHNLQGVNVDINGYLTVVTGISGSGKTSLVFDTLYHEAKRRFLDVYSLGSPSTRLIPAEVEEIKGLGPAVAVGQNLLNRNPGSILATASGLHPFFRLLFARFGKRLCPQCGLEYSPTTEDDLVQEIVNLTHSYAIDVFVVLFRGVVGSHQTLLSSLSQEFDAQAIIVDGNQWWGQRLDSSEPHNIDIKLPYLALDVHVREIRQAVQRAKEMGSHSLMFQWNGKHKTISLAPVCISCGYWFNDLEPVHFHTNCPHCEGRGCSLCFDTGLTPQAAAVTWEGYRFTDLLTLTVDDVDCLFSKITPIYSQNRIYDEIIRRVTALQRVGLGYLGLDRSSPTLSRGEAQRVRLALSLICRLEDMLHILDEPTIGQHPADVKNLLPAFRELPGPVIFVEHDRQAAAQADQAIDLGPGAGKDGGKVVFSGTTESLWSADTITGRYFSLRETTSHIDKRPPPMNFITVKRAYLRNLKDIDVAIPIGCLTAITGVSGSGKSTFVEDVLVPSLLSGEPKGCKAIEGMILKPVLVDQSPIGRNPRSNPATYTKLSDLIRDLYANVTGLSASHFSFNRQEGACPTCKGLGAVEVAMRYLPSTWIACSDCEGERFTDLVLVSKVQFGQSLLSIADFYRLSISEALLYLEKEDRLNEGDRLTALRILTALNDVGLGYLSLGQPSPTLSGGEAQRVKLARYLGQKSLNKQLLILDEPSTGLHPYDLSGLLIVLDRLVRLGATIIVVEHNLDIVRATDWVIDLGPGAGDHGGYIQYAGSVDGLIHEEKSLTAVALIEDTHIKPGIAKRRVAETKQPAFITIHNAQANNLKNCNAKIPKGQITVVTGISGSGKSSLVRDVLETEARRRYLETLSMYERQGVSEGPEAMVESISGLGVALTIGPERLVYSRRATAGTATEISHHIAVLFANISEKLCPQCHVLMKREINELTCPNCGTTAPVAKARHFYSSTYSAACQRCNGIGSLQMPQPKKLIIHPAKPLVAGAMYSPGFFPNGYLGKPYNGGYYQVLALGERYGFDPAKTPWNEMTPDAQHAFLFGNNEPLTVTYHSRTGRISTGKHRFPGFYGFIRDWDVGGTYTDNVACPACNGARLRSEYLAFTIAGLNIHQINQLPFSKLLNIFNDINLSDYASCIHSSLYTIQRRLSFLNKVGLGYLHLDRVAGTLSAGEAQRIRLANLLGSRLTSLTLILDEPTRGLHPLEVKALLEALVELRNEGNTVIVVEHDPMVIQSADNIIDFGPGAGRGGGHIVAQGNLQDVLNTDTITTQWLRGYRKPIINPQRCIPKKWLTIVGARSNNLIPDTIQIPLNMLVGVCGVSGSGKSTLLIDTLGRALAPKKQTTSVAYEPVDPGEHDSIEGSPARTLIVDQSRAGMHSPAAYLDMITSLRKIYAESEDAVALGLDENALSTRCSSCGGSGSITLDMAFLPDVHIPCETCRGTGYLAEAWNIRVAGISLPELLQLTIDEVYEIFKTDPRIAKPLGIAREVGLGYLIFRQPGHTLSGGEAQRLKIAHEIIRGVSDNTLYILDEPTVGQHLEDVQRLAKILLRLVKEGGSVIVIEHHPHILAICDWLLEMGPGGGPDGGKLIATGTPEQLASGSTPIAQYLSEAMKVD